MRNEIEAICEELNSWQQSGISRIYVENQSLNQLEALAQKLSHSHPRTQNLQNSPESPQSVISTPTHPNSSHTPPHSSTHTQQPSHQKSTPHYQSKRTPTLITLPTEDTSSQPTPDTASKKPSPEIDSSIPDPIPFELPQGDKQTQWNWLKDKVLNCTVCNSHIKPGKKVVFGVGNINADIFFCGEAPGADEEIEGEPFVGKAGQLLTKIIQAMGLQRPDVYIGNIMNWRPETGNDFGNRPPSQREMAFCLPYLKAQLNIIQPKVIVALGNTAVTGLLGPDPKRRMTDIRGTFTEFEGVPLMITYHPSYLLRNNTARIKRQVWEDILLVMERIGMPISDKQRRYFSE